MLLEKQDQRGAKSPYKDAALLSNGQTCHVKRIVRGGDQNDGGIAVEQETAVPVQVNMCYVKGGVIDQGQHSKDEVFWNECRFTVEKDNEDENLRSYSLNP